MSAGLGKIRRLGALSAPGHNKVTSGAWIVAFDPAIMPREQFEVWHGAIRGPGGFFLVYLDEDLFGVGANGRINEYVPTIPMLVNPGQAITLHWSITATPAPECTFWFRRPEVGRI